MLESGPQQALNSIREGWRAQFRPPERLNVWEWSEKNLVLSGRVTSYPGTYRTSLTPYVRGPMAAFHTHDRIVLCFASQTAKTTALFAMIGFIIDQDPGPVLIVLPTADLAKRYSKKRLQPIINDSPSLASHKTSVEDDFQLFSYTLDRLTITLVGSNSPAGVSSDPIRYLFLDEVDKFALETTSEADAMSLAMERVKSFWNSRTIITSTPTGPEGNVWHQFKLTDQRYFEVPCPRCGSFQRLVFENLRWPELKKSVRIRDLDELGWYECAHCNGRIEDRDKQEMLDNGQWIAEAPGERWAGFHLNILYPLWKRTRFGAVAAEYLRSKPYPDKYRNFQNSWLALPWDPEEEGEDVVKEEALVLARDIYRKNTVPASGALLVMGVDVQEAELYFVVFAFARKDDLLQSWLVNWGVLPGLEDLRKAAVFEYPCVEASEPSSVRAVGIDSRYRTAEIYEFCRQNRGFLPLKGMRQVKGETGSIPWKKHQVDKHAVRGLQYYLLNTVYWKEYLFGLINQVLPKIWHIPEDVDPTYLRHIASEKEMRKRNKKGQWERVWVVKKGYADNHYLDATVYAYCVADILGFKYLREVEPSRGSEGEVRIRKPLGARVVRSKWMEDGL